MENFVDKQQMDALKALAATTLKVSDAKTTLIKLEETETEYLVGREKKAMECIQKVHDTSADLLQKTQENYDGVTQILSTISGFTDFITKAYGKFQDILKAFDERNVLWEENCKKWEEENQKKVNELKLRQSVVEGMEFANEKTKKKLSEDQQKLDDRYGTLERAIKRLKEGRI